MKYLAVALWLLVLAGAYELGARGTASDAAPASALSLEASLAERNPLRRSFEVSRSLRELEEEGVANTLRAVEAAGFWFDAQDHQLLMFAWVPIDSTSATGWALARPGLLARRARIALLDAVGFFNPARARGLVSSLGSSKGIEALHLHMIQGWARSERKDGLTRYIEKLPQGIPRQQAIRALINEILKGGPDALIAWADAIPVDAERQFKRATFQKSVNAMARIAPARASEWIDGQLDRRYASDAPRLAALRWLEQDPAAAMDWIVTLPEGNRGANLVKRNFKSWMKIDFGAAQKWARGASPAAGVDPVVRVLVRHYFDRRPAQAMEWARRIHTSEVRVRVQTSAGRAWLNTDREAFMAWLPESGLKAQVRDLILNSARLGADGSGGDAVELGGADANEG